MPIKPLAHSLRYGHIHIPATQWHTLSWYLILSWQGAYCAKILIIKHPIMYHLLLLPIKVILPVNMSIRVILMALALA